MTSKNNPFADRLAKAAKEGYVNGTSRTYGSPFGAAREVTMVRLASDKQIALITSLMDEKDLAAETRPKYRARTVAFEQDPAQIRSLSVQQASALIEYLFGLPKSFGTTSEPAAFAEVPAGHYAIEQDDKVVFLQVDRPETGKWAGKVFVKLQHGDDYTNMSQAAGFTMLGRIVEQGIMDCSIRYGRELGKCGVCHRTLTNETSRSAGIGPKCAEKFGM